MPESSLIFPLLPKRLNVSRQTKALLGPFCCQPPPHKHKLLWPDRRNKKQETWGEEDLHPFLTGGAAAWWRGGRSREKLALRILRREQTWKRIQGPTHQLPGVAHVVGVPADVSQPVGVPGQRRVDGYADDLTPQRKAGRTTAIKKKKNTPSTTDQES